MANPNYIPRDGYLENPYLTEPYLGGSLDAHYGMQVKHQKDVETEFGMQTLMIVNREVPFGQQVNLVAVKLVGSQATLVVYNNTQIRFLYEFPSRGTPALGGLNWLATNQAAGDFSPNNLNSDVEEEVFRSSLTTVSLICDTGIAQGTTITDFAMRNTNLTKGAIVQVQGSNDAGFGSINYSFNVDAKLRNSYYIAPTFPIEIAKQNRYWRVVIQDTTNPDGYIQIGCIIFGNAKIFAVPENMENPINYGDTHYKDVQKTEGFTGFSNDRALKRWLKLTFDSLETRRQNLGIVQTMGEICRTSLKILVIPKPYKPEAYAVFAKLVTMPDYSTEDNSDLDDTVGNSVYTSFELHFDESE